MAAGLAEVADRPVQLTVVAVVGAQSSSLDEQIDRVASRPAGRRGDHDRRQRRDPPGPSGRRRCAISTTRCAGCAAWAPRSSSAPAPTSARWSRSPSRCAGSPGARAGHWPRRRPSPSSRPAGAACRSATSSGRSSPPRRRRCSGRTASTRRWPATPAPPPCCCPRWARRWTSGSTPTRSRDPTWLAARACARCSIAAAEAADVAGTEVAGAQVAGRDRGPRGRWALLRRRPGQTAPERAGGGRALARRQLSAPLVEERVTDPQPRRRTAARLNGRATRHDPRSPSHA